MGGTSKQMPHMAMPGCPGGPAGWLTHFPTAALATFYNPAVLVSGILMRLCRPWLTTWGRPTQAGPKVPVAPLSYGLFPGRSASF